MLKKAAKGVLEINTLASLCMKFNNGLAQKPLYCRKCRGGKVIKLEDVKTGMTEPMQYENSAG